MMLHLDCVNYMSVIHLAHMWSVLIKKQYYKTNITIIITIIENVKTYE